jgi:Transposase IS200 like
MSNCDRILGEVFRKLAAQRDCRIGEGHLMADHVHMMISIPPKHAVSQLVGFIKGKSAIHLARVYGGTEEKFCRPALLGQRVLRLHTGTGRAGHPGVHQESGTGGQAPGTTQSMALTRRLQAALEPGAASATPTSRFERLTS